MADGPPSSRMERGGVCAFFTRVQQRNVHKPPALGLCECALCKGETTVGLLVYFFSLLVQGGRRERRCSRWSHMAERVTDGLVYAP